MKCLNSEGKNNSHHERGLASFQAVRSLEKSVLPSFCVKIVRNVTFARIAMISRSSRDPEMSEIVRGAVQELRKSARFAVDCDKKRSTASREHSSTSQAVIDPLFSLSLSYPQ